MKLCSYCRVALGRDNARFCQNCGKPTSPQPLSPTTVPVEPAFSAASPGVEQTEESEDTLHVPVVKKSRKTPSSLPEQIAQQPGSNMQATRAQVSRHLEQEQPAGEEEISLSAESANTFTAPPPRTELPVQELPVSLEDQDVTASSVSSNAVENTPVPATPLPLDSLPSTPLSPVSHEPAASDIEEDAMEDRPTLLLESHAAEALASDQGTAEETTKDRTNGDDGQAVRPVIVQPIPAKFSAFPDAVSRLTSPLPAIAQPISAKFPTFPDIVHRLTPPLPAIAQPISAKLSALPDAIRGLPSSVLTLSHMRQRLPVTLVAAVLVALVLIGVGSWLFIAQPFSVPPVTQPQLGFSDAHLGLSLLYPNGWTSKKDAGDSTAQFYDSSHTAQVIIAISNTSTSTITASLQKQSAQLGISGAKSVAPLSFAGASWQGMQGTVQQSGASYTCTIFATTHANHLVMLTQLAPQSVYSQEDSVVFASLRQSLRFV